MTDQQMDIGPGPSLLLSYKANALPWSTLIGEIADNSLDAGATRVDFIFGSKALDVIDDGQGCDDLCAMLTLGRHVMQRTTRLGMWGVGLKESATSLWGTLEIETTHRSITRRAFVDWSRLAKQSDWKILPGTVIAKGKENGTHLRFRKTERDHPKDWQKLADDLGYMFMPALSAGKQIKFAFKNRQPILCKPYQLPPMSDVVTADFDIDGKGVSIRAGIVDAEHANWRPGFAFVFGHRVLMNSSLGANGKSTARVAGIIELKPGWKPSKNKTSIVENTDELESAIYARLKEMLARAQNQAIMLTGEAFTKELNERMKGMFSEIAESHRVKERRDRPKPGEEQIGTIDPQKGERKRKPRKTQPGERVADAFELFARGGKIDWKPFEIDTFGEIDLAGSVIWLNENNKTLLSYRASENRDAVLTVAIALFVAAILDTEQKVRMPIFQSMTDFTDFAQAWSKVMAGATVLMQS